MVVRGDELNAGQLLTELRESGYSDSPENPLGFFKQADAAIEIHPGAQSYFRAEPAVLQFAGAKLAKIKMLDNGEDVNEYLSLIHI